MLLHDHTNTKYFLARGPVQMGGAQGPSAGEDATGWVTVLGKLFTPIVPLFTKQQNW